LLTKTTFTSTTKSKTGFGSNEGEEMKFDGRVMRTSGDEDDILPADLEISGVEVYKKGE
jgi:hypothetical protein